MTRRRDVPFSDSNIESSKEQRSHFQLHFPYLAWFDFFITAAAVAVENASATQEGGREGGREERKREREKIQLNS